MKIGIITYHFARNYGAVLQCYALCEHLRSLGHDTCVLNYVSDVQMANNSLYHKRLGVKNVLMNIALSPFKGERERKEQKFADFVETRLNPTRRLRTVSELEAHVDAAGYDVLISGSDQVFCPSVADFDEAFFLPFGFEGKKVSFAASLGTACKDDLERYAGYLADFDYLGIRESGSLGLVEQLSGKRAYRVADPVFLLGADAWSAKMGAKDTTEDGYVLLYYIKKAFAPQYLDAAKAIAAAYGLPLRVVNARFSKESFGSDVVRDAGPEDFVQLFHGATAVCTDSFHGTAFSLIFQKPFVALESVPAGVDSRKTDLLGAAGCLGRSVYVKDRDFIRKSIEAVKTPSRDLSMFFESVQSGQRAFLDEVLRD